MPVTDLVKEKKMRLVVGKINNLPTPSAVFTEVTRMISDPNVATGDIAAVIARDPALSAKVLKLTNSSFYGIPRTITSVRQATVILGLEVVKSLVLSASVFDMFSKKYDTDAIFLEHFWRHSLAVAFMARILSKIQKSTLDIENDMSFSEGLLHDIGKLIIISQFPSEREIISNIVLQETDKSLSDAEVQVLGFSHTDIGAYLCAKWNLSEGFCEAVLSHHDCDAVSSNPNAAMIHMSNYLAHQMNVIYSGYPPDSAQFYPESWATLGIFPEQEMPLIEALLKDYVKADTFLSMAKGDN